MKCRGGLSSPEGYLILFITLLERTWVWTGMNALSFLPKLLVLLAWTVLLQWTMKNSTVWKSTAIWPKSFLTLYYAYLNNRFWNWLMSVVFLILFYFLTIPNGSLLIKNILRRGDIIKNRSHFSDQYFFYRLSWQNLEDRKERRKRNEGGNDEYREYKSKGGQLLQIVLWKGKLELDQ